MTGLKPSPIEQQREAGLSSELGALDFTLLVVGAVVGADIYVVAAMGAQFLGPAQLVAWLVAGILAALIALAFIQCAAICPEAGGSYAYARAAWGPLVGFLAGWTLYVGEWVALPVFPIAFVNYLAFFLPSLSRPGRLLIEVALIGFVTGVNLLGVRFGSRLNDVLTVIKLLPLALLVVAGLTFAVLRPETSLQNLTPFAPIGWGGIGPAILLIFWAYAGFELAVLPASEVKKPGQTLPRGLILGMAIATSLYLLTSFATVVALPWQAAATSPRPLADAFGTILTRLALPAEAGFVLMSLGGLISIVGVYDVFTLSLARLSYAMATDGLFPPVFARIHPRHGTPTAGLLFQATAALAGTLLFDLTGLIAIAVFFLGICYALTALSALRLLRRAPERVLHLPALRPALLLAAVGGAYLSAQASPELVRGGVVVIVVGLVWFGIRQRAWEQAANLRKGLEWEEQEFVQWARRRELWLLRFVRRHSG